ncbi:MAG: cyanophycinase [Actinomycetota bacterium]|nr:MAG: cyanophycinase [Actinomycetota bacterium]
MRSRSLVLLLALAQVLGVHACAPASADARAIVGDPADVRPSAQPGLVLMGGGPDVDEAFRWMLERSGFGDVVVLRASGGDGYNDYLAGLGPVDSVETIVTRTRAQADAAAPVVRRAEAIVIAGGDQAEYLRLWRGTELERAIRERARSVPVGGTSAGLAILGDVVFSAERGTVYSGEALRDPFNRYMTFERDFLDLEPLAGGITDSHFRERNRMGRLVSFLARMTKGRWVRGAWGVGIDEATALLVEPDGTVELVGEGSAFVLRPSRRPALCRAGEPLTMRGVRVWRLDEGDRFDLATWRGVGVVRFRISAIEGRLRSSTGRIYG